jgi:hypothetical protein
MIITAIDSNDNRKKGGGKKKRKKIESQYGGGTVFEPVPGIYRYAISLDVGAMYPTIIDTWNLDPLTICCDCCKDDPLARIPSEIMRDINIILISKKIEERGFHYWICRKHRGRLADIFHKLIQLKKYFKEHKMTVEEKAVKLVMNSGYGVLASTSFKFFFYKIPELVTGIARFTIGGLPKRVININNNDREEEEAISSSDNNNIIINNNSSNSLRPIYADTDSLFLEGGALPENAQNINKIISLAKTIYGVDLSKDKTWKLLILSELKKQYCGIVIDSKTGKDILTRKTMTGLKNDRPPFSRWMFNKLISEEYLRPFEHYESDDPNSTLLTDARQKIKDHFKESFAELKAKVLDFKDQEFIEKELYYSFSPDRDKSLDTYDQNSYQKECFREYEEMRITKGLTVDSEEFQDWIAGEQEFRYWKIKPVKVPNEDFDYENPESNMKTKVVKDKKTKQPKVDEQGNPITKQVQVVTEERDKIYTCLYINSKLRGYEIDLAKYMTEMVRASAALLKTLGINVIEEIRDSWYKCKVVDKKGKEITVELLD